MLRLALLALLVTAPAAEADALVSGFATDLPAREADDAFELWNPTDQAVDLSTLTVLDGEGQLTFPSGASLLPNARVRVALQYADYEAAARDPPDFAADHPEPSRRITLTERFLFSQTKDELWIERNGVTLDAVAWGEGEYAGPGWTGTRVSVEGNTTLRWWSRHGTQDHDSAQDWSHPQREKLGWRPRATFPTGAGTVTAYTAPDRSREHVTSFIRSAQESLRINIYEFRDPGIARDLLALLRDRPHVEVDLLADVTPVGLEAEERLLRNRILRELETAGARVRLITHHRYGYDHAKYLVADRSRVLVQSENLVPTGVPMDGASGNRGWGAVVDSPAIAQSLADAFDGDFALDPFGARLLGPREVGDIPLPAPHTEFPRPARATATASANVTLLLGPESNLGPDDLVLATLREAREEILLQQLRVPPVWRDASGTEWSHQYLQAIVEAAHRGVRVRVLVDESFLDASDDDNAATLAWLEDRKGAADLEGRLWAPPAGVLHNKGLVVDGRYAFVGSMNWNLQSVAHNREILLRLDSPAIAGFYRETFFDDWAASLAPRDDMFTPSPSATLMAVGLLALAATLRRGPAP